MSNRLIRDNGGMDKMLSKMIEELKVMSGDEPYMVKLISNLENTLFIYRCRYVEIRGVHAYIKEE